ncbi:MAG: serpin family protein [Acidobacteriota bacterium]|nr:serpin family protein [Acidobacteriota bacterium]
MGNHQSEHRPDSGDRVRGGARRRWLPGAGAALLLAAAGCGEPSPVEPIRDVPPILDPPPADPAPAPELPRALTAAEIEVIDAGNRFAFDLLREASRPGDNLFLSPLSASVALGMTMNGAGGETWNQMREALGFGGLTEAEINGGYASLIQVLTELDPAVETAIGNSVWNRLGFPLRADFVEVLREFFGAEAMELDFASPSASGRINEWVRSATGGHIEEIVPAAIPPGVVMYLINAIYFKAPWTFEFDPDDTRTEPFYPEDRTPQTVPLMTILRDFPYLETNRFQAVDLPYGGGAFSMTALVPRDGVGVDDVLASLDAAAWENTAAGFEETEVELFLPRFRMEYERELKDDLAALGMVDAFTPGKADLGRLSPVDGLWISSVLQKALVEVTEEGTEAAAATVVTGVTSAPPPPVTVRADRPFLFLIRERLTGAILFAGKLAHPPDA